MDGLISVRYDLATRRMVGSGETVATDGMIGGLDNGGPRAWVYQVVGSDVEIRTIDTATGRRIEPTIPRFEGITGSAANRDGTRLAVGRSGLVVYDTTTGKEVGRVDGHFLRGAHITDGGVLVAWSLGGEMTLYDLATLRPLRTLSGNRGFIIKADSDAAGDILATVGGDHSVALHDVGTGVQIGDTITVADDEANTIALRPDGKELLIGGSLETGMQAWDLDPADWVDAACRLAGRNLTSKEWESNLGDLGAYRSTCPQYSN